ncbi:MAG: ABC transporter permease subunit/CPBP intramembrane protease [Planctomycetota bacterium]
MSGTTTRLWRLTRKELRETLRDRRTMLTLVVMPLLVYPLLSMALNRFLLSTSAAVGQGYLVGVATEAESTVLQSILNDERSQPPSEIADASDGAVADFQVAVTEPITVAEALISNQLDIGAVVSVATSGRRQIEVIAYAGDDASLSARRVLIERLQWLKLRESIELVSRLEPEFPFFEVQSTLIGEEAEESLLASVLPLVLVLMTITGAVYPAIDLTAGERERGTMEALMASPVPRGAVLVAKYIAVVFVAMLTAVVNLVAMTVTLSLTGLWSLLVGTDGSVGVLSMIQVLGILVLFSGFFSAVLLSLTSFAKSFKEAQAYLIPVMLLSLGPAMLSLMPGMTLSGPMAVTPLINIVLLAQGILSGDELDVAGAMLAIVSTIAYASAALALAAKLFGSDAVTRSGEASIGSLLQRPRYGTPVPTATEAGLLVALLLPVSFVVSNGLTQWVSAEQQTPQITLQLIANAIGLVLAFGFVPFALTWFSRHQWTATFRLRRAKWSFFAGASIVALGGWAFAHELVVIADQLGLATLREDQLERTRAVLEKWKQVSPILLLATLAFTPAVIEELCFRGFLFSAFRSRLSPVQTVVITSLLFGAFHVFVGSTLLIERFLPTTLLGLILGFVAWRSGSVWPGMWLHFLHNALLELVARYHESFEFLAEGYETSGHLPWSWLASAGCCVVIGLVVIRITTQAKDVPIDQSA